MKTYPESQLNKYKRMGRVDEKDLPPVPPSPKRSLTPEEQTAQAMNRIVGLINEAVGLMKVTQAAGSLTAEAVLSMSAAVKGFKFPVPVEPKPMGSLEVDIVRGDDGRAKKLIIRRS
jgi:hypothetical protein